MTTPSPTTPMDTTGYYVVASEAGERFRSDEALPHAWAIEFVEHYRKQHPKRTVWLERAPDNALGWLLLL